LQKAGLVWKRIRKSLRSKRDQAKFDAATVEIKALIQQHKNGGIDLCYFDEAGFTLEPSVPYAWQPTNETIEIPSSKSKRLNVLGVVNRDCEFNLLANQIKKQTVIVIDNASIHTSNEFNSHIVFSILLDI
jgi:hypothetical protein